MTRIRGFLVVALVLVSCSPTSEVTGGPASSGTTVTSPTTTVTSPTTTVTFPTTTVTFPTTTVTFPTTTGSRAPVRGAAGIGDSLYPGLGNGGYEVDHYDLDLAIDPEAGTLEGTATISATAKENLAGFNLDLVGLDVDAVTVDGEPVFNQHEGRELAIRPGAVLRAGTGFEVTVNYHGEPLPGTAAVPLGGGWQNEGDMVYVIDEPDGAASWFPANDHPRDPATFTITLTVPAGYDTVTSGRAVSGLGDPDQPDKWDIPEQTATYLVAMAIGHFEHEELAPAGSVDLSLWYPPDLDHSLLEPFHRQAEMIDFFSERFGDFPFARYGALIIDDPSLGAALETQTLSTFGTPILPLGEQLVAHEMAHQWFGDTVRLQNWSDVWLNEGFATLAQWLWLEHRSGQTAYNTAVSNAYNLMSGASLAQGSEGPALARLRFPPPTRPAPNDLFNRSVYLRGGLALVALRDEVGDDLMWRILTRWHERYGGSTATTEDFVGLVQEMAGTSAARILSDQLSNPLPPAMPARGLAPPG